MTAIRWSTAALACCWIAASAVHAQDFPKPGPQHEALKKFEGAWETKVKFYLQPDKADESTGEMTAKLDVGGFFLFSEFKGKMLGGDFKGRSMTGYDPFKKKYVGTWVDSMSPSIYTVEGEFEKEGKVYKETMEGPDPTGKPMKMRLITEFDGQDHMHVKMYGTEPGADKERLMMEIHYTRKKQ